MNIVFKYRCFGDASTDITDAKKYNVRGIPTVFVNGLKLVDRTVEGYKARIDNILKAKAKKKALNMRIFPEKDF